MTWTDHYRLHSIEFYPDGNPSTKIISGAVSGSITANPDVRREITAGSIYADTAVLQTLRPVGSFTTFNLEAAFGTNGPGLGGADSCITSATNEGLNLFFARYGCAGPDSASSDHIKYNIGTGILVPNNLTVDHQGNAQVTYDIYAQSSGGADPVVKSTIAYASLPTLTGNDKRWTMNQMSIGGTAVEGKRNITVNFNASVARESADSDLFDSVVSLDSMLQRLTVQGVQPKWLDTVTGIEGETVTQTDSYFYLKERNSALAASEHIKVNFNGLVNWDTVVTGDTTSPAGATVAVDLHTSGANNPISVITSTDLLN